MYKTFGDCTKLSGNIVIDANPKQYTQCFEGVNFETQGITLSGSSAVLEEIKSTGKM